MKRKTKKIKNKNKKMKQLTSYAVSQQNSLKDE